MQIRQEDICNAYATLFLADNGTFSARKEFLLRIKVSILLKTESQRFVRKNNY